MKQIVLLIILQVILCSKFMVVYKKFGVCVYNATKPQRKPEEARSLYELHYKLKIRRLKE